MTTNIASSPKSSDLMRRLRHGAVFLGCKVGSTFRTATLLRVIRSTILRLDRHKPSSKLSNFLQLVFDPNQIRKLTRKEFNPRYLIAEGVLGEMYRVNVNDHSGWRLFIHGYFDITPIALGLLFNRWLPQGTLIDVGANIGSTSIPLAKRGIAILGIEASPGVISDLSFNVSLNSPIPYTIVNIAVTSPEHSNSSVFAKLFSPVGNMGASSLIENWNPSLVESRSELARLSTLDEIFGYMKLSGISLIKMDIEGSEYEALLGLEKTLSAHLPSVVFEWRPDVAIGSHLTIKDLRPLFPKNYRFFGVKSSLSKTLSQPTFCIELEEFVLEKSYENVLAISESAIKGNIETSNFVRDRKIVFQS